MRSLRGLSIGAGLVASVAGCGALLGVGSLSYEESDGGGRVEAGGGDGGATTDAFACGAVDVDLCADFEGNDLTGAYVHGKPATAVFQRELHNGGDASLGAGIGSPGGLLLYTPAVEQNQPQADLSYVAPGASTHVHLELDALVSISPTAVSGGSLSILFVKLSDTPTCYYVYEYANGQAQVFDSCPYNTNNKLPAPLPGVPTHVVVDAQLGIDGLAVTISNGYTGETYQSKVVTAFTSLTPEIKLGGSDRVPVPEAQITIDNVTVKLE